MDDGLYAEFQTNKGNILIELTYDKTPLTVANFVGLAEGKIKNEEKELGVPYYDGLIFHRVIPGFMIQGGDPQGSGMGGPGYKFADEFHPDLKHDKAGTLSMANSGPGTNGSQFFITDGPTPHLDNKHSVFGYVVDSASLAVVKLIANVAKGERDIPVEKVVITHLEIIRSGKAANAFDAPAVFEEQQVVAKKRQEEEAIKNQEESRKQAAEFDAKMKNQYGDAKVTASGLKYVITEEGVGEHPKAGQQVSVHYTGYLTNGQKFDSSVDRGQPLPFQLGKGQVIPGWDEGISLLKKGGKGVLIIPPELAYGANGAGGVIPPNATLVFEVELVDFK